MESEQTRTNIVNNGETVTYYRRIHEVTTADHMNLIMTRKTPVDRKPAGHVMLVHGLGQNRYTWTLTRRSLENYLVKHGFETFNIELRGHGMSRANGSDHPAYFDTYLNYDMPAVFDAVAEITGGKKVFYMGHSLGGSIAYATAADYSDRLAGIISIGGPFYMARGNPLLKAIARTGVSLGRLYPFQKVQPEVFYIDYIGLMARFALFVLDNPAYRSVPLQIWYPGSIERDILEERIVKGFDRTSFNVIKFFFEWGAWGKFVSSDGRVDFEEHIADLTAPILFVNGDEDVAVPPEAVRDAYEKAGAQDKTFKTFGENSNNGLHWGHCDLICGRHAPEVTWPYMLEWMQQRLAA
ncbi:MAG: alpha/beta fold hydrolase [Thermodesulfobacteriota bacterium]